MVLIKRLAVMLFIMLLPLVLTLLLFGMDADVTTPYEKAELDQQRWASDMLRGAL